MTDLIEAMARGLHAADGYGIEDWSEMSEAGKENLKYLATAAYNALRETLEPVGYKQSHPKHFTELSEQKLMMADKAYGWIETPLYALPEVKP